MNYDFTTLVDRSGMSPAKQALMREANPAVPVGMPSFSIAGLDLRMAPEIIEGLKSFLDAAVLGYTRPPASFTHAVIEWLRRRHDWTVEAEWIVLTGGVVPALIHVLVRDFMQLAERCVLGVWPFLALCVIGLFILGRKYLEFPRAQCGVPQIFCHSGRAHDVGEIRNPALSVRCRAWIPGSRTGYAGASPGMTM